MLAGAAILALIVVLVAPRFRSPDVATGPFTAPPITGPTAGPAGIDLSAMPPREAADRLFNRVMQAVSAGDTAEALAFQPMALGAYERVADLDLDGHYHVAVLHIVGDDPAAARERAETILSIAPTHLFGLYTAGQAEEMLGNRAAALEFYSRFLEHHDAEIARGRPEYAEHAPVLPVMREEAERAVRSAE
jgi:tetratricopeptide (TPR) repeat protein